MKFKTPSNPFLNYKAIVTVVATFTGCTMAFSQSAYAEGQLNIYNWGDYINPEVLTRLRKTPE